MGKIPKEELLRLEELGFKQEKWTEQFSCHIISRCGVVSVEELKKIVELSERYGNGNIFLDEDSYILVEGIHYDNLEKVQEFCSKQELYIGGLGRHIRPIRTCNGRNCNNEVMDSYALADKIRELFFVRLSKEQLQKEFKIVVSGCPQKCNAPKAFDIGIVCVNIPKYDADKCRGCKNCSIEKLCQAGAVHMEDDKIKVVHEKCNKCGLCISRCPFEAFTQGVMAYRLLLGGHQGKTSSQTIGFHRLFTTEEAVLSAIDRLIFLYQEEAKEGEYFGEMIERVGMNEVEKRILC